MNLKISQLSATTNPQDSDVFPVVNFGETKKVELRYITNAAFRAAQTAFLPLTGGTVFGNVIVNGDIITSSATSDNWNDTYTIVDANSAMWGGASDVYTTVNANSATWNKAGNVYTTVNANSAIWSGAGDVYTTVNANSADWESAFTTVQAKSGTWESSIDGSGTIGYLPKFTTNSSTLGNSVIYESGSQLKINNPPLSATLNVEGSYLQTVNGNGDYVIRIQDGSGRVNHYWNTVGGTGPTVTYMRPNEGARKILFGGETQPLFQVSSSSLTSPTTGVAGDTIIWEDAFTITSGGNVGIGTSIPNKPLTVSGDISANDIYSDDIYTESLFLSSANPLIRIVDSNAATKDAVTGYIGFYAGNGIVPAAGAGPNRAGWMGFGSTLNNNLQVRNESEDGTVILSVSGNSLGQTTCATFGMYNAFSTEFINHIPLKTGIGTDNPTEELTVIGNVEIANSFDPAVLRLTETSGANAIWEMRSYHTSLAGGSGNEFSIYGGEDGQPLADRFVIEPDSGNVGVGFVPVATSSKLTIKGSISASNDVHDSVGKIWNVRGQAGDIVFIKDASTGEQETFKNITEVQLSETPAELTEMTTSSRDFDFASVFDEWKRFGANPADWTLDVITPTGGTPKTSIKRTANVSYGGFISNLTYDQYLHEVRLFSTHSDDDEVSIIIAYKKVGSTDCYLKAVRSPGNPGSIANPGTFLTENNWQVVAVTPSGTITVVDADSTVPNPNQTWDFYGATDNTTGGVKVEVLRDKDNITCRTTDFATSNVNSAPYLTASAVISFNLTSNPALSVFRGSCSIGYSCNSQDATYFDVQKFTNFIPGYDVTTGAKYTFNTGTKVWTKHTSQTLYTDFKIGRILTDTYTRKTFYISDVNENIKIGDAGTTANRAFSTVFRNLSGQARATSFIANENVEYTGDTFTGTKTSTGTYLKIKVANGTGGWNDRYILLYS
jgi:hypothetical protein